MTKENSSGGHRRRDVFRIGAAGAVAMATFPAQAQEKQAIERRLPIAHPKPPFKAQSQSWPGLARNMEPRPDLGETTYRGSGRLAGMKALITGGDSGIGAAAAIAYAREGADVAINYLPVEENDAQDVLALIRAEGRNAVALPGDLRNEEFCRQLIADAEKSLGGLDILVSNAGRQQVRATIADLTSEDFDDTMKTNVYAMFWLVKAAVPLLKSGSAIVLTSSRLAADPQPNLIDYGLSKAAIVNFAKSVAKQLAPKGIRVNAVAPAQVWTPIHVTGGSTPENQVALGGTLPIGRPGQPAELAPLFVTAADPALGFSTGEVFAATGGVPQPS